MPSTAEAPPGGVHLLVVDDHEEQREAVADLLRDPSYRILTAASGEEALRQLLVNDVALVLLDVRMPKMDGFETAALIRRRAKTRETPILFLTAGDLSPKEAAEAAAVGAADYITKPVDAVLLRSKVSAFVKLYLTRAKLEGIVDARTEELLRTNETLRREVEERRRTQEEFRFLGEVSAALASSLDYQATLHKIAELAVPTLADWAAVDLLDDAGGIRRVALVHRDPSKLARARAYHERRPPSLRDPHGIGAVLRGGEPEFTPWIPDLLDQADAWDPEDRRLIEDLRLRSVMIVPFKGRDRVMGAISLIAAESERRYGEGDLTLAVELGRRASLALENARLYGDLQRELEERRKAEADLRRANERQAVLSEASRLFAESNLDLDGLLQRLTDILVPEVADSCYVRRLSDDGRSILTVAVRHRDPETEAAERALTSLPQPSDQGMTGELIRTQKPVFLPVIDPKVFRESTAPQWRPYVERGTMASYVMVAMRARGSSVGALGVGRRADRPPFTRGDLDLVQALADRAGLALATWDAFRQLNARTEALRASEERFRKLVEGVDAIVWEADPATWQFTYVSPQAERMLGYPMDRWLHEKDFWIAVLHPEDRETAVATCLEATRAGRGVDFEYRVVAADGRPVWIRDLVYAEMEDGRLKSLRGLMFDVTERRKAEERLAISHEVLENMVEGVSLADETGTIVYTNPAEDRMFGYARGELIGRPVADLNAYPPEENERVVRDVLRVLREKGDWQGEWSNRRKDGTPFTSYGRITTVRIAGRTYFVCVQEDITERKIARGAAAHLAAIVRSSNDAILTLSLDGRILSWNEGARGLYGYEAEEVVGRPIVRLIPEERRNEERAILERIGRGERVNHYETIRRRKDGSLIPVSLTVSPLRDGSGAVVGVSKIARDITAAKRAEREIRDLNQSLERRVEDRTRELREAVRELEGFAYTVAHDLRAPVRAMTGFATILLEDNRDTLKGDSPEIARRIVEAGQRMDRLLQDLLAYSRLSREDLALAPVDLGILVPEIVAGMRLELEDRRAEVAIHAPLPRVRGHGTALSVALTNLLANAVKFVAPGVPPRVDIRAEERPEGRVRLWVEDNGVGISSEYHEKIFGVFERLHGQEHYPGTGIGLALVRRAAERMGGTAGVESAPGRGSRFYLELAPASAP